MPIVQPDGCPDRIERELINHGLKEPRLKGLFVLNQQSSESLMRDHPGMIRTQCDQRIKHIGNGNNAGLQRDGLAHQATRVALAVPPFVVAGGDLAARGAFAYGYEGV